MAMDVKVPPMDVSTMSSPYETREPPHVIRTISGQRQSNIEFDKEENVRWATVIIRYRWGLDAAVLLYSHVSRHVPASTVWMVGMPSRNQSQLTPLLPCRRPASFLFPLLQRLLIRATKVQVTSHQLGTRIVAL